MHFGRFNHAFSRMLWFNRFLGPWFAIFSSTIKSLAWQQKWSWWYSEITFTGLLLVLWYPKFLFQGCNSCCDNRLGKSCVTLLPIQKVAHILLSPSRPNSNYIHMYVYHHVFKNLHFWVSTVKYWVLLFKGLQCLERETAGYFYP